VGNDSLDWFLNTGTSKTVNEINTMTITTIGKDGFLKSSVVLLKKLLRV
jgi:pyridoxine/pyridoxamine 5'-phosphate oxidase